MLLYSLRAVPALSVLPFSTGFDLQIIAPPPTWGASNEERDHYKYLKNETLFSGKLSISRFAMFREGRNPIFRALRYLLVNCIQYF